jgi:isoleucyl-tRNA synthetase
MYRIFDPKPDFPKLEEEILKFWEDNEIFKKSLEKNKAGKSYAFYDGPPFATGTPHYGHLLGSTVKDLVGRYQTMKGNFVRRRWGWDCHGLPIEEIVERKLGISGKKQIEEIGIKKFNETCRNMVLEYVSEWRKVIRRLARWVDFDNSYKTMDRDYMESVWWAFKNFYDKGLVYEGRKVLLYCPRCETPISNFEVAMDNSYKDLKEETVVVKFKLKPGQKIQEWEVSNSTYILAWTTTPWTLPGNVALAVGKDIEYVKVLVGFGGSLRVHDKKDLGQYPIPELKNEYVILAKDRVSSVIPDLIGNPEQSFKGSDLVGLEYEPLFNVPAVVNDKSYRVYAADFVTTEDGTGIVHTAVVYGEEDYELGQKVGLPVVPLLDEKGKFNSKAPKELQGMDFKQSESFIKKDLEERRLLFAKEMHTHSYPHCWRCGNMLFYNAIPAWFVNIQKIKKDLIKSNEKEINWYPDHLKHGRYEKSVEMAPDWNISRNRYWGNPIPVWKCENVECGNVKVVGSIKELGLGRNTFYFMRHGEARQNVLGINSCYPEAEVYDLTDDGVKLAENAAKILKKAGVDMIFSSDILRTKHTAEIVGEKLGIEVTCDERLREYNVGKYNGRSTIEFNKDFSVHERWEKAPEGGENWTQILERMLSFVRETNKKYEGKTILVVSHADPMWTLMQYFGSEKTYPTFAQAFELDVSIEDLHRPYIDEVKLPCDKCGGECRRIPEIFDSWVEAGSMPFAEFHYPFDQKEEFESRLPAQFVAEYIAQTRAWFYVMHVIGLVLFKKAPFENVVTTGTILAEDGSKMSKSKKNYPDPMGMVEKFGMDSLRFYLMNSPVMQGENVNFSENILATVYRKNILILWNVFSYFITYANEAGWQVKEGSLEKEPQLILDQWVWIRTQELINETTKHLDAYNTVQYTRAIEAYINDLSTWYVRRSRGRKDDEFFLILRHCLIVVAKVSAPVMPYISEIIYQELNWMKDRPSVHLEKWKESKELDKKQQSILKNMQNVRELVEIGHSQRKSANIKLRQPLLKFTYTGVEKLTEEFEKVLAEELNVKNVVFGKENEIDQVITLELKQEGLIRELERLVQGQRKEAGLKVGEIVDLEYDINDEELAQAMEKINKSKSYIRNLQRGSGFSGAEFEIETKKVILKISKV